MGTAADELMGRHQAHLEMGSGQAVTEVERLNLPGLSRLSTDDLFPFQTGCMESLALDPRDWDTDPNPEELAPSTGTGA